MPGATSSAVTTYHGDVFLEHIVSVNLEGGDRRVLYVHSLYLDDIEESAPAPVLAVVGRHVHQAGAAVGGDERAGEERAGLGIELKRPLPIALIPPIFVIPAKAGTQ